MPTPGWIRVPMLLDGDTSPSSGSPKSQPGYEGSIRGYGLRIVQGAQFISKIRFLNGEEPSDVSAPDQFYDGAAFSCPGGFSKLQLFGWSDNPIHTNASRVLVEVCQLPAVVKVEDAGQAAHSSYMILPAVPYSGARLHPQPGDVVHVSVPASTTVRVAALYGADYWEAASELPANRFRSRTCGNQRANWFTTPGMFLHGFLACKAADTINIWFVAMHYDGNGAALRLPYFKIVSASGTTLSQTFAAYYTPGASPLDRVFAFTNTGVPTTAPIPIPPNGIEVWVENTHGTNAATVAGIIAARSVS